MSMETPVNKQFKDNIFRYIFKNPKEFEGLYKSLTGKDISAEDVRLFDLESVVTKDWRNDISFLTKDNKTIILMEAQSTMCANMAVRCLVYYADLIKSMYKSDVEFKADLYSEKNLMLPSPEFLVAYNGSSPLKYEVEELRRHFAGDNGALNLNVQFMDINLPNLNKEVERTSKSLYGYSFFLESYRQLKSSGCSIDEALKGALNRCRENGYLLEYVDRKEFVIMSRSCMTVEEEIQINRKIGIEEGIEKGRAEEKKEMLINFYKNGFGIDTLSKTTGMPAAEIKEIVKDVDRQAVKPWEKDR